MHVSIPAVYCRTDLIKCVHLGQVSNKRWITIRRAKESATAICLKTFYLCFVNGMGIKEFSGWNWTYLVNFFCLTSQQHNNKKEKNNQNQSNLNWFCIHFFLFQRQILSFFSISFYGVEEPKSFVVCEKLRCFDKKFNKKLNICSYLWRGKKVFYEKKRGK